VAWLELLRISNVLTAVADVWMGMIVTTGSFEPTGVAFALSLASVCLYLSGMVLNDVFDADSDANERPERPIPSGRISRRSAAAVGYSLMTAGLLGAAWATLLTDTLVPLYTGIVLATLILTYDRLPTANPIKPWLMGACRGLNVLLGMSVLGLAPSLTTNYLLIALAMLIYIAGVTLFARTEALTEVSTSNRRRLAAAMLVALAGIGLFAAHPWLGADNGATRLFASPIPWAAMWVVVALLVARRFVAALLQPSPARVQSAVGNAITSIIVIDAVLAAGYAGPYWGLTIFALLPLTLLMARFIPQT
jgi:4-hydroxybenzoate polyprenyltransferase